MNRCKRMQTGEKRRGGTERGEIGERCREQEEDEEKKKQEEIFNPKQ